MTNISLKRHFYTLLVSFFVVQICTLFLFHFKYTDSDQTIMWLAALDMFDGKFYTPAFYGQSYNTHFESLVAVPFLFLGVPVYYAVPLATFLIFIVPFLCLIWILFKKNKKEIAIGILIFLLLLPIEWNFFVGLSRGFITGISLSFIGVSFFIYERRNLNAFLAGFFIVLGFFFNPNMVLFILIFVAYLLLNNKWRTYFKYGFYSIMGGIFALSFPIINFLFHRSNPDYIVHFFPKTHFSVVNSEIFLDNINSFFKLYTPFAYEAKYLFIPMLIFIGGYLLWEKKNSNFLIFSTLILSIIALSYYNKIVDGTGSVFFPYGRMFFALSFIFPFIFMLNTKPFSSTKSMQTLKIFVIICVLHSVAKIIMIDGRAQRAIKTNSNVVDVISLKTLKEKCTFIDNEVKRLNAEILVTLSKNDFITYGCPCITKDLKTIHPRYERRTWLMKFYKEIPLNHIVALSYFPMPFENIKPFRNDENGNWYLIQQDELTLLEFYKKQKLLYYLPNE